MEIGSNRQLEDMAQDEKHTNVLSLMPIAASSTSEIGSSTLGGSESALISKSSNLSRQCDKESNDSLKTDQDAAPPPDGPGGNVVSTWRFTCLSWAYD